MNLIIKLLTDTTFGRGDGVIGVVDQEVEHDPQTGLPIIRGRTLKGLLVEACADVLYMLEKSGCKTESAMESARWLFGSGGSTLEATGHLRIGQAQLPNTDYEVAKLLIQAGYKPQDVLEAATSIRRQTAMTVDDVPEKGSLRASRVVLNGYDFTAPLTFDDKVKNQHLSLLVASASVVHQGGSGRNRGRGKIRLSIDHQAKYLSEFFADTELE